MKKLWRLGLILLLLTFFAVTMTACRCAPFENQWYIQQATYEKTFLNGQRVEVTVGNYAHYSQPDALYDGNVNICFEEDGTVIFKPVDGAVLTGTYTYSHNGLKDTSFQMQFADGSETTDGVAASYYGGSKLSFTYRGVFYEFTDRGYTSEEYHLQNVESIAGVMRDSGYTGSFHTATITRREDGKWQLSEVIDKEGEKPIDIYAEDFSLEAVHITENNEVVLLDELREGTCFCIVLRDYNDWDEETRTFKVRGAVLYYVDPLPTEPGWEDLTVAIEERLSWLPEARLNYENIPIKLTLSATNLAVGFTESHQYLREAEEVREYLEVLSAQRLWLEKEEPDFSGGYRKCTVSVTVGEQNYTFSIIDDYLVIGEEAYRFAVSSYAWLTEIDYSKAVETIRTDCDLTEVYNKDGYLCSISGLWQDLEFVTDPETYNWPFSQDIRTLQCDFGEVTVFDAVHFRYKGQNYIVAGEKDFSALF